RPFFSFSIHWFNCPMQPCNGDGFALVVNKGASRTMPINDKFMQKIFANEFPFVSQSAQTHSSFRNLITVEAQLELLLLSGFICKLSLLFLDPNVPAIGTVISVCVSSAKKTINGTVDRRTCRANCITWPSLQPMHCAHLISQIIER